MKKLFLLSAAGLLMAGCSQATQTAQIAQTSNTTLTSCLTQKAYASLTDGSLQSTPISTLAQNIATSCIQTLALQKAGLDDEAINTTTALLATLKQSVSAEN